MAKRKFFPYNDNYSPSDIENMGAVDASTGRLQDTNNWPKQRADQYKRGVDKGGKVFPLMRAKNPIRKKRAKKKATRRKNPAKRFTKKQLATMRASFAKIDRVDPGQGTYNDVIKYLDKLPQALIKQLAGARIKFLSGLATNRIKGKV